MTPARKKALQWFHDMGAVSPPLNLPEWLTERMFRQMMRKDDVELFAGGWSLTDKGRRMLHGDEK